MLRGILSTIASLFDLQGVLSPIGVIAKILFQELCVKKVGWDDPLPEDKHQKWEAWLKELNESGAYHLRDSKLWWEGPEWLRQEEEKWPLKLESSLDVTAERKKDPY